MTASRLLPQIWQDLQPMPGRVRDSWKVTFAALLICLFMFSTSMPFVDLGVYLVFLLAQRDTMMTRMLGVGGLLVVLLSMLLVLGVMLVAWDIAWLRVLLWTVIFFVGYFLMRIFIEPDLFLGPLVIVALCTFLVDDVPLPNLVLNQLGWLWAMLPVVVAGVLLSEWLFGASSPRDRLIKQTQWLFDLVAQGMRERASGRTPVPVDVSEVDDAVKRASLLAQTHTLTTQQAKRCVALIRSVVRLDQTAGEMQNGSCSKDFWKQLGDNVAAVGRRIRLGAAVNLPTQWMTPQNDAPFAQAINSFRQSAEALETGLPPEKDGSLDAVPPFLADWRTNPIYISFALRTTAATMGSYLFMTLTNWNGIHTCMITCVVTALAAVNAQMHKQNLRMAGAVVGALMGVGALIFFLPHHQSLFGLLLVIGVFSYLAAWVAVGPLRIYYAGYQMALAVYYVLLYHSYISTELDPIRDRLIGIFVGIVAMRIAFLIPFGAKKS